MTAPADNVPQEWLDALDAETCPIRRKVKLEYINATPAERKLWLGSPFEPRVEVGRVQYDYARGQMVTIWK